MVGWVNVVRDVMSVKAEWRSVRSGVDERGKVSGALRVGARNGSSRRWGRESAKEAR